MVGVPDSIPDPTPSILSCATTQLQVSTITSLTPHERTAPEVMSIFFGDNEICDEICDNFLNFIALELSPLPWTLEQLDTSPGTKYFLIG